MKQSVLNFMNPADLTLKGRLLALKALETDTQSMAPQACEFALSSGLSYHVMYLTFYKMWSVSIYSTGGHIIRTLPKAKGFLFALMAIIRDAEIRDENIWI